MMQDRRRRDSLFRLNAAVWHPLMPSILLAEVVNVAVVPTIHR